jgi:hypothetical protein
MAGVVALDTLPHLRTHYGSYDISPHSRSIWPRVESSLTFQTNVNAGGQKDASFSTSSALSQVYPEPPVRDGLRTPPADDMSSTAYQPQQYRSYGGKQESVYPSTASYASSTAGQQLYLTTNQPSRTSTVSTASNLSGMSAQSYSKAYSPKNASTAVLAPVEETARRKSGILPSLQIPSSINNSGGSLGEFAAQVYIWPFM